MTARWSDAIPWTPARTADLGKRSRPRGAHRRPPLIGDVAFWLIVIAAFLLVLLAL